MSKLEKDQIHEVKKSVEVCFHCEEKREIILFYSHTFYIGQNMKTEIMNFCWKCVSLLDKDYYLNYGYTISENLLVEAQKNWNFLPSSESQSVMAIKIEFEPAEKKIQQLAKKVGKIMVEIGQKIPLKCITCSFNSNILVHKRQKCQNIPKCFSINPKTNQSEFCNEHKELKCENKNCDYQEWLEKKIETIEPIVKKYGLVRENNIFTLFTKKVSSEYPNENQKKEKND